MLVRRVFSQKDSVLSVISIDDKDIAFCLENRNFLIPEGYYSFYFRKDGDLFCKYASKLRYPLTASVVREFGIPFINVKGREGIAIHPGNYAKESRGCLLPGSSTIIQIQETCVNNSLRAFLLVIQSLKIEDRIRVKSTYVK